MPNHGKGGRPREGAELKRCSVPIKTTATLRSKLETAAREADRSMTQEIEARLETSLADDRPERTVATMRLLTALAADIERVEQLTGKRWDQDLKTWAMVREALASGEIERQCPQAFATDAAGYISELRAEMNKATSSKVQEEIFLRRLGIFPALAQNDDWPRHTDKTKAMEQITDAPGELRQIASDSLERLVAAEAVYSELWQRYSLEQSDLIEAVFEGVRDWNADLSRRGIQSRREFRPGDGGDIVEEMAGLFATKRHAESPSLGSLLREIASKGNDDAILTAEDTL